MARICEHMIRCAAPSISVTGVPSTLSRDWVDDEQENLVIGREAMMVDDNDVIARSTRFTLWGDSGSTIGGDGGGDGENDAISIGPGSNLRYSQGR